MMSRFGAVFLSILAAAPGVSGSGFLVEKSGARLDAGALDRDLRAAMDEALGCGGRIEEDRLQRIERKLEPMWRTLPKNGGGNVDRRSLRYLVHRHFNRESALHIRGFEPTRPATAEWGSADILSQRVPAFVESVLESRHKLESGFNLRDAAYVVATLEQLIFDFEGSLLQRAYHEQGFSADRSLTREGMERLLESYMIHWMLGDDEESIDYLLGNRSQLASAIPHWQELVAFSHGQMKSLDFKREALPRQARVEAVARAGHNALAPQYSFEDAHGIVGGITRSFASYWESECSTMKAQLVEMDTHHTGRVPLSKFYGTGIDADWRFGESESYLRELGALDETSWRGKQVIIPNYIQAASNCIISAKHYLVCCVNDCEALLEDIEVAIGAPSAEPSQILAVVGNLSSHISVDDDLPPELGGSLTRQLEQIAETHGGSVPLHGRLFAQWLHYAYPRECPFPHRSGAATAVTPLEFGQQYVATSEEMWQHAQEANATDLPADTSREELQWMSQWSPEEELITEHAAVGMRAPWERGATRLGGAALLLAAGFLVLSHFSRKADKRSPGLLPTFEKDHYV